MPRRPALLLGFTLSLVPIISGTAGPSQQVQREVRCMRFDSRIADLQLKLRMGYSARQGRVLKQKLAALRAERRKLCGG